MNKIDCEIIRDLLPLYHDEAVSEKTAEAVKEHLAECAACKEEFENISAALPTETEAKTTGEKFARFMKKHRIKRAILTGILIFALITGTLFAFNIPVINVPFEHFGRVMAYRYEDENGHKRFCVIYCSPEYSISSTLKVADFKHPKSPLNQFMTAGVQEDGGTLEAFELKPIISGFKKEAVHETIWTFDAENLYGEYGELVFGGETVWTLEENADDPVPEYVYYFDKLEQYCWKTNKGYTWIIDYENNIIGGGFNGEEQIYWTLDGSKIE